MQGSERQWRGRDVGRGGKRKGGLKKIPCERDGQGTEEEESHCNLIKSMRPEEKGKRSNQRNEMEERNERVFNFDI